MGLVKDVLYTVAKPGMLATFKKQSITGYYHLIDNRTPPHIKHRYTFKDVDAFVRDIRLLKKQYSPLDPKLLFNDGDLKIPENSFLITFDDGLRQIYQHAFPILAEHGISAVSFLNPDFVDNKALPYEYLSSVTLEQIAAEKDSNKVKIIAEYLQTSSNFQEIKTAINSFSYTERDEKINSICELLGYDPKEYLADEKPFMTLTEIEEMRDHGFYFGGHTMSHPRMQKLDIDAQKEEAINSIKWVKEKLALDYACFAFPFTDKGISAQLIDALFSYDEKLVIFGNSGIKKDIHPRIIQRISLEKPERDTARHIVMENLYSKFEKLTGAHHIKRNG